MAILIGVVSFSCISNKQNPDQASVIINQEDENGNRVGPWEIYDGEALVARGSYEAGEPDGLWTYWYPNGEMKAEGHFEQGIKSGMWVEWYNDGVVMWKGEWENGTRQIDYAGAAAEVMFPGQEEMKGVLAVDSVYHVRIRIQNIPAGNLFVEVSSGQITRENDTDLFILETPSDSAITMAIGYIPDLNFRDFRNLVSEIKFNLE